MVQNNRNFGAWTLETPLSKLTASVATFFCIFPAYSVNSDGSLAKVGLQYRASSLIPVCTLRTGRKAEQSALSPLIFATFWDVEDAMSF